MPDVIRLTSPTFTDGGAIPEEHTCDGGDVGTPGRNGFGGEGWGGPCPPSGEHRFVFELVALSGELDAGQPPNAERLRALAADATLARGELTGVYARR